MFSAGQVLRKGHLHLSGNFVHNPSVEEKFLDVRRLEIIKEQQPKLGIFGGRNGRCSIVVETKTHLVEHGRTPRKIDEMPIELDVKEGFPQGIEGTRCVFFESSIAIDFVQMQEEVLTRVKNQIEILGERAGSVCAVKFEFLRRDGGCENFGL